MPKLTNMQVQAHALNRGDLVDSVEADDLGPIVSGKKALASAAEVGGRQVTGVNHGRENVTVDLAGERAILREWALVNIRRSEPTDEELAEAEATKKARAEEFRLQSMMSEAAAALRTYRAGRTRIAEAVEIGATAETLAGRVDELLEAEVKWNLWQQVLTSTGYEYGFTILDAVKHVADQAVQQLAFSGADDTWSGRGNDRRRMVADAKREWLNSLRWSAGIGR